MTLTQSTGIYELHLATLLILGGLFIFIICLFLLMLFFGFSLNKLIRNVTFMGSILIMVIAIPVTAFLLSSETNMFTKAKEQIHIFNLSVNRIDDKTISVSYNTSSPAISYLEIKPQSGEIRPVFPEYDLKEATYHVLIIHSESIEKGLIYIIINGERYQTDREPILFPD